MGRRAGAPPGGHPGPSPAGAVIQADETGVVLSVLCPYCRREHRHVVDPEGWEAARPVAALAAEETTGWLWPNERAISPAARSACSLGMILAMILALVKVRRAAVPFPRRQAPFSLCTSRRDHDMQIFSKTGLAVATLGTLLLFTARPVAAQYATLSLQSQPGEYVGGGVNSDVLFTPANTNNFFFARTNPSRVLPNGPVTAEFIFGQFDQNPDNFTTLDFSTEQLGTVLTPGTYTDAQSYPFGSAGHPELELSFNHRGSDPRREASRSPTSPTR